METEIFSVVQEVGMGVVAFGAIIFFFYKNSNALTKITENHLTHIQDGIEKMNEKMDRLIELLKD